MDNNQLESITDSLRIEEKRLADEVGSLKLKTVAAEAELARIQSAIKHLVPKQVLKRRQSKPAVSTEKVRSIINELSSNHPTISTEELKKQVGDTIKRQGFSKVGFALRFKQALQGNNLDYDQHKK